MRIVTRYSTIGILVYALLALFLNGCKPNPVYIPVKGGVHPLVARAEVVPATDLSGSEIVEFALVLKPNSRLVPRDIGSSASENSSPTTLRDIYHQEQGITGQHQDLVIRFAKEHQFEVKAFNLTHRMVRLSGTTDVVEKALGIDLRNYKLRGQEYRSHAEEYTLPDYLNEFVESIQGLTEFPLPDQPNPIRPNDALAINASDGFSGMDVAQLYSFPEGTTGKGQTIGIIELGGGYLTSDLQQYFSITGQGALPEVIDVSVLGAKNNVDSTSGSGVSETNLDLQLAMSAAPGARFVMYFAPNSTSGFLHALKTAVHDTINRPDIISISWGDAEKNWSPADMNSFNSTLEDAARMKLTVLVATGDKGSSDGYPDGNHVQFPSSSPFATACGGTTATLQQDDFTDRTVWANFFAKTGGGFSSVYTEVPSYQQGVVPDSILNYQAARGTPDVAAYADNFGGYLVVINGKTTTQGGTSAVSPLWAALTARLNESIGRNLGFLNPILYPLNGSSAFYPVLDGSNGAFVAGAPWNPCTGLGSPNGEELLKILSQ